LSSNAIGTSKGMHAARRRAYAQGGTPGVPVAILDRGGKLAAGQRIRLPTG
jgi:hypothetical protein